MKRVQAKCIKTYPDKDDMQKYCEDRIDEPCDVKIYHKGQKYFVIEEHYDTDYYEIVEPRVYES